MNELDAVVILMRLDFRNGNSEGGKPFAYAPLLASVHDDTQHRKRSAHNKQDGQEASDDFADGNDGVHFGAAVLPAA